MHCHAGCDLSAILAALDLPASALFDAPSQNGHHNGAPRVVETYDYTDERGVLLYQVVRTDPKGFRQRRPDGKGGWIWRLDDVRRVIYRLPAVLRAVRAGEEVWIAEGERDVGALVRQGVAATCNPGGAGKWHAEYSEALGGAAVVVVADADTPGRRHAEDVAAKLGAVGATVRVVEARSGKDATDHFSAGFGLDEFLPARAADAPLPVEIAAPPPEPPTEWPALHPDGWQGPIADAVEELRPHTEADPHAVYLSALTYYAAMIGIGPAVGLSHPPQALRLFAVIVGDAGAGRKGASEGAARWICVEGVQSEFASRIQGGFGSGEVIVDALGADPRLVVYMPELSRLLRVGQRVGDTTSELLREAWDRSELAARARQKSTTAAPASPAHVCLLGHVTPTDLSRHFDEAGLGNGWAARVLWCLSKRSGRVPFAGELPSLRRQWNALAKGLAHVPRGLLPLDDDVKEWWNEEAYDALSVTRPGKLESLDARAPSQVMRLAGVLSVTMGTYRISMEVAVAARHIWDYCAASAALCFDSGLGVASPVSGGGIDRRRHYERMDRLCDAIRAAGMNGLTGRQRHEVFARHVPASEIEAMLGELERLRRVRRIPVKPIGGGPEVIVAVAIES